MEYFYRSRSSNDGCGPALILLVLAGVCIVFAVIQVYPAWIDVDKQLVRTQVSSNMVRMVDNLRLLQRNMEEHGVTEGHSAEFWRHSAENDVALDFEAVISLRERAQAVIDAEKGMETVEYATTLDDIRGTLREIEIDAWVLKLYASIWFYLAIVFVLLAGAVVFLAAQ